MGWLFSPRCVRARRELVRDLERLPELRSLDRRYYVVNLGYALLLWLLGEAWSDFDRHAMVSGAQLVVWGSVLSTVCVYHIIWSANSFCDRYGTRRFATPDNSRNNLLVSLLTLRGRLAQQPSSLPDLRATRIPAMGNRSQLRGIEAVSRIAE